MITTIDHINTLNKEAEDMALNANDFSHDLQPLVSKVKMNWWVIPLLSLNTQSRHIEEVLCSRSGTRKASCYG